MNRRHFGYVHPVSRYHVGHVFPKHNEYRNVLTMQSNGHVNMMFRGYVKNDKPNSQSGRGVGRDTTNAQVGNGIFSKVLEKLDKGSIALKNKWGNAIADKVNPNWRPGFPGELHLMSKKGLTYNFCGPRTKLQERLERGDPGLDKDGLDNVCKAHDIAYSKATSHDDIRQADEKMLKDIDDKTTLPSYQKLAMKGIMKSKIIGEDTGVFGKNTFTNVDAAISKNTAKSGHNLIAPDPGLRKKHTDPTYRLKQKFKSIKKKNKKQKAIDVAIKTLKNRIRR